MKDTIPIPISDDGKYDLQKQKELADKYEQIDDIKKSISQKILTLSEIVVLQEGSIEMAREKKDGRHINLYIEREIIESLEKYCEKVGQTKTVAIERALKQYLAEFQKDKEK